MGLFDTVTVTVEVLSADFQTKRDDRPGATESRP
jgi:hypothetical protein